MHICFVALNSYNLFSAEASVNHIGGAETQQYLMARWLLDNGHKVSVVTLDHGQPQEQVVSGIRIVKAYDRSRGLPLLRFFVPRWSRLNAALRIADADIYYQRGAGFETGQVAGWCRRHRKPFVFASASDLDCDKSLRFLQTQRERLLYRYGLRHASAIVVQSGGQARQLEQDFGRSGLVIRSSGRLLGDPVPPDRKSSRAIWLGRLSPEKRFEWVLEIAAACKEIEILVLGASNDGSEYARKLLQRAASLPNIKVVGYVAESEVADYYNQSRVLLLTSPVEGFPNVFLEAWQLGLPVITTVDPDGIVEANRLGWHVDSPDQAARLLREHASGSDGLAAIADRVRRYFRDQHLPDGNMPGYIKLFQDLLDAA